jgi:hypothetical protein
VPLLLTNARSRARAIAAALALFAAAPAAFAQSRVWVTAGTHSARDFTLELHPFGDRDGDGVVDVTCFERPVGWKILSGATGVALTLLPAPLAAWSELRGAFDWNGDLVADYLATGAPASPFEGRLLSGSDGALLHASHADFPIVAVDVDGDGLPETAGFQSSDEVVLTRGSDGGQLWSTQVPAFAPSLLLIHDFDGDGVRDLVATSAPPPAGLGAIVVLSTATGAIVATGGPAVSASPSLNRLHVVRDRDGDGHDEIVLSNPDEGGLTPKRWGAAWFLSSASLATLARVDGSDRWPALHFEGDVGDFDGDGASDLAVRYAIDDGAVEVRSGATLRPLCRFHSGELVPGRPNFAVAGVGDVDHDGRAELCLGRPREDLVTCERGRAVALTVEPFARQLPPPSMNPTLRQFGDWTFRALITGLQPGSPLLVELVEYDGLPYGPITLRQSLADVRGEVEGGIVLAPLDPPGTPHTFGLRATAIAANGTAVITALEHAAYY